MKYLYVTPVVDCIFTADEDIVCASGQLMAENNMYGEGEDF